MNLTDSLNWRLVAFYAGVPFFVAVYGAANNWEIQQIAGYGGAIAFYLSHSFIPWWITCLSSSFLMWALDKLKPPPLAIMIPGSLIGCVLTLPYTNWITALFESLWPTTSSTLGDIPSVPWSGDFIEYLVRATVVWVAVNFVFDRFVGLPRYRYEIPRGYEVNIGGRKKAPEQDARQAAFIERLPVHLNTEELVAIKAEQHYIRIFTAERDYMILYRFSDAVSQLETDLGMQVHRSWWVAHNAIRSLHQNGKKLFVLLSNSQEAPVSTPYQGLIKELAKSRGIAIKPQPQKSAA